MLSPRQIFKDNIRPAELLLKAAAITAKKVTRHFQCGRMTNE